MPISVALVASVVPLVVGALVWGRQPQIGCLLVLHGVCFGVIAPGWGFGSARADLVADQLASGMWVLLFLWLALIGYLLPTGRPASSFWRWWIRVGSVGAIAFVAGAPGDTAGFREAHPGAQPPITWLPAGLSTALGVAGLMLALLLLFASPVACLLRLRSAEGDERLQLLWLVWGATTVPLALVVGWAEYFVLGSRNLWVFWAALGVSAVALPVAIGVAILRHRLFDIELVLSRTLTYGVLTAFVLALYGGLLAVTGHVFADRSAAGPVAVAVVAVSVQPAYIWVRRRVERWIYGLRSEPHVALRLLVDRTEAAEPDALVRAVADAVAEALRADAVQIGPPGTGIPLVHRGECVGDLSISLPAGRTLGPSEESLLKDLTRYAAVLVRSAQLYDEVRESRARIVAGREEERRRLRSELHDGLGPSLAAIVLKLSGAQNTTHGQSKGDVLVAQAKDEVKTAIAEVRRLVDGLRPPAVDEVGLLQAIRQRAAALSGDLSVEVDGPAELPPLPAAVETAAFRIASEAMTNAVRHSHATRCRVTLLVGDDVELSIRDNGRGLEAVTAPAHGMGLASMRQRASELGGSLILTNADQGLLVHAVLPLIRPELSKNALEAPA